MSKKDIFNYFQYNYVNFVPYIQQLDDDLKDEPYASTTRTMNWSVIKIGEDKYLYAVRYGASYLKDAPKFTPGNSENCTNPMEIGYAYWWNKWHLGANVGGTYFFIGNHLINKFEHCKIQLEPDIIKLDLSNIYPYNLILESNYLDKADIRLVTLNNQHWLYDTELKFILPIRIDENIIIIGNAIEKREFSRGKNYAIISLNSKELKYLDWYYVDGVTIILKKIINEEINFRDNIINKIEAIDDTVKWIKYDEEVENDKKKFIITGNGSYDTGKAEDIKKYGHNYGKIPLFSFTTPHIPLTDNGRLQLGVGHIKIHTDQDQFPYLAGSKIQVFRDSLYKDMKAIFGDRYIRHKGTRPAPNCQGYIYMLYFYILEDDNNMKLSDAFLPIYLDPKAPDSPKDRDYKFSLIFPMGLAKYGTDKIMVTCGEGDFYSVALEFNIIDVINSCIHNVKRMDMDQYNYYIIAYKNKKHYIINRLSEIMQTAGTDYYYKYLKYKTKYMRLRNKDK